MNSLCALSNCRDLNICVSMRLVVSLLLRVFRKQPQVTFEDPSPKRQRYYKEIIECLDEPLLQKTISVLGRLY